MRFHRVSHTRFGGTVEIRVVESNGTVFDAITHSTHCGLSDEEKDALLVWMGVEKELPSDRSKFGLGARLRKIKGASWQGIVVGHYATDLTPDGVAVESEREKGSVQIYPVAALEEL